MRVFSLLQAGSCAAFVKIAGTKIVMSSFAMAC